MATASYPYLAWTFGPAAVAFAAWLGTRHPAFAVLGGLAAALGAALAWFFRDPERRRRPDPSLILAPGDGRVVKIHAAGSFRVIEIFLAVWNVHLQRAPVAGRVTRRRFTKGSYLAAFNPQAGTRNTRCETWFATPRGPVGLTQIAGAIARKVECWVKPGDRVAQGERVGIIHLGSQVRVTVRKSVRILVRPGEHVRAGLTPLARWR